MIKKILAIIIVAVMTVGFVGCYKSPKGYEYVKPEVLLNAVKDAGFNEAWIKEIPDDSKEKNDKEIEVFSILCYNSADLCYNSEEQMLVFIEYLPDVVSVFIKKPSSERDKVVKLLNAIMPLINLEYDTSDAESCLRLQNNYPYIDESLKSINRNNFIYTWVYSEKYDYVEIIIQSSHE